MVPASLRIFLTWAAVVATGLLVAGLLHAIYNGGRIAGKAACEATQSQAVEKAEVVVHAQAKTDITRAHTTGLQREQSRRALDTVFTQLSQEAAHEKPDPVDSCVLPASRLRLWAAANAGAADSSTSTGQPDGSTASPAAAPIGPDAGAGSQPPGGSPGIPPVSQPDVRAADLPAT